MMRVRKGGRTEGEGREEERMVKKDKEGREECLFLLACS